MITGAGEGIKKAVTRNYATVILLPHYKGQFLVDKLIEDKYDEEEYEEEESFDVTVEVPTYDSEGNLLLVRDETRTEKRKVVKSRKGKKIGTNITLSYISKAAASAKPEDIQAALDTLVKATVPATLEVSKPKLVMVNILKVGWLGGLAPANEATYIYAIDAVNEANLQAMQRQRGELRTEIVSPEEIATNKPREELLPKDDRKNDIRFDYYNDLFIKLPNFITFIKEQKIVKAEEKRIKLIDLHAQFMTLNKNLQNLLTHIEAFRPPLPPR
jgi:hypothetical protein